MRRLIAGLVLWVLVASCSVAPGTQAEATCEGQARAYGSDFVVAGAFATTVGVIRSEWPTPSSWADLDGSHPATLCYLDGPVAKSPPPGEGGEIRPSFDRAVVGVADDAHADLFVAGYRAAIPVAHP